MRGIYSISLVIAFLFLFAAVFAASFDVIRMNTAFIDYRRALERKYLEHDISLSYVRMMGEIASKYSPTMSAEEFAAVAAAEYTRWVSAWAAHGFSVSASPPVVAYTASGPVLFADTDILWTSAEYSGKIHVSQRVSVWTGG